MGETFQLDAESGGSGYVAPQNTTVAPDTTTVTPSTTTVSPSTTTVAPSTASEKPVSDSDRVAHEAMSWVDELSGLMDNPQQGVIPTGPPPGPPQYAPQYYAPPPYMNQPWNQPPQQQWGQAQQTDPQAELDNLLRNPQAYIQQIASAATMGQQQYVRQMEAQIRNLADNSANASWDTTRKTIEDGYRNVLSKDNAFRGNPQVKATVEGMLKRAMGAIRNQIAMGNYSAGYAMADPTFFPGMLYIAKLKCGVGFTGQDAMTPVGATMEGVTPPSYQDRGAPLPPDLQGVADFLGPAFEKELKSMVASADQRGDFSWKG